MKTNLIHLLNRLQRDSLQCVVGDRAGAEVADVVQTDEHSWIAGAGDGRQEAGGPALGTLPLVVLQVIVFCLPVSQDPLKVWDIM